MKNHRFSFDFSCFLFVFKCVINIHIYHTHTHTDAYRFHAYILRCHFIANLIIFVFMSLCVLSCSYTSLPPHNPIHSLKCVKKHVANLFFFSSQTTFFFSKQLSFYLNQMQTNNNKHIRTYTHISV